jgi:hypothetical protein
VLFNNPVNCFDYIVSIIDVWNVGMEQLWNDINRRKLKYPEKTLFYCYPDYNKSQDWTWAYTVATNTWTMTWTQKKIQRNTNKYLLESPEMKHLKTASDILGHESKKDKREWFHGDCKTDAENKNNA